MATQTTNTAAVIAAMSPAQRSYVSGLAGVNFMIRPGFPPAQGAPADPNTPGPTLYGLQTGGSPTIFDFRTLFAALAADIAASS